MPKSPKIPRLIACLNLATASPPGHVLKMARAPWTPVAHIHVPPTASDEVKALRRELAAILAAAPQMQQALHLLSACTSDFQSGKRDASTMGSVSLAMDAGLKALEQIARNRLG